MQPHMGAIQTFPLSSADGGTSFRSYGATDLGSTLQKALSLHWGHMVEMGRSRGRCLGTSKHFAIFALANCVTALSKSDGPKGPMGITKGGQRNKVRVA